MPIHRSNLTVNGVVPRESVATVNHLQRKPYGLSGANPDYATVLLTLRHLEATMLKDENLGAASANILRILGREDGIGNQLQQQVEFELKRFYHNSQEKRPAATNARNKGGRKTRK